MFDRALCIPWLQCDRSIMIIQVHQRHNFKKNSNRGNHQRKGWVDKKNTNIPNEPKSLKISLKIQIP